MTKSRGIGRGKKPTRKLNKSFATLDEAIKAKDNFLKECV